MRSAEMTLATAAANTSKAAIGGQIVSKTLDTVNRMAPAKGKGKYGSGNAAASYDFNKAVLSSVYSAKGAIASVKS